MDYNGRGECALMWGCGFVCWNCRERQTECSPLCVQVRYSSSSLCNSTGKAVYVGKESWRYDVPSPRSQTGQRHTVPLTTNLQYDTCSTGKQSLKDCRLFNLNKAKLCRLSTTHWTSYYLILMLRTVCVCLSSTRSWERNVVLLRFFHWRKEILLVSCTNCFLSLYDVWFESKSLWNFSAGYALKVMHARYTSQLPWAGWILPTGWTLLKHSWRSRVP